MARCSNGPTQDGDALTSTREGETNFASPRYMSTPSPLKRSKESLGAICVRSLRIRSITTPKSTVMVPAFTPKEAARATSCAAWAARMTAFEGTQPVLRQSPPVWCRSMSATRAPSPAAPAAATRPAVPAPTMTRLY